MAVVVFVVAVVIMERNVQSRNREAVTLFVIRPKRVERRAVAAKKQPMFSGNVTNDAVA